MRINNAFVPNLSVRLGEAPPPPEITAPETLKSESFSADSSAVLSPELTHWLQLVAQEPEIRPGEVERVSSLLAGGHYLSTASASQTAAALLAEGF